MPDPRRVVLGVSIAAGAAYLQQTVAKLEEEGIHDSYLWELQRLVAAEIHKMHQASETAPLG